MSQKKLKRLMLSGIWGLVSALCLFANPIVSEAATITVTSAADSGAGSLRDAITNAASGDTIIFGGDYTIYLASTLTINKSLTIDGTGHSIVISGDTNSDGTGEVRIVIVNSGVTAALQHLTLTKGNVTGDGGAIYNYGNLTVSDCSLSDNTASRYGGAVMNSKTMTVTNSAFAQNTAGYGGGVMNYGATANLTISDSAFSDNSAITYGGGIENCGPGAVLMLTNSTFSGNTAGYGGAIINNTAVATIVNSTFSGNSAVHYGGGIENYAAGAAVTLTNSTFAGNNAATGGALYNAGYAVTSTNTIYVKGTTGDNCYGTVNGANNLADDTSCGSGATNSSAILPGALGTYGGPSAGSGGQAVQTIPLLPGSAAIDAGDDAVCTATDQRGMARKGFHCDIGAFESQGFTLGSLTGTPQSTVINTDFAVPLGLTVTPNDAGEPVDGGQVTFMLPPSGAGATITGSPATISGGMVSVTETANSIVGGPYNVTASTDGALNAGFALTNTGESGGTVMANVSTGDDPSAIAVNPVTNKVYIANCTYTFMSCSTKTVTVIDGATNETTQLSVGVYPYAVAVNPVTNKVYAAGGGINVAVIDGYTNEMTTVAAGGQSVAVNPVTNKIYVPNWGGNVTVIDGVTNETATVSAGHQPWAVAVNPVTNKVYVANRGGNVTVIDGVTNETATVSAGTWPWSVAVNPVTNKVYVANANSNNVTVIDGATNETTTVSVGGWPEAVAVNPVTNKVYVANYDSGNVTVIDGVTNSTTTIMGNGKTATVAVNPVTNKVYIASNTTSIATVIDGATNTTSSVSTGTGPRSVAVNPVSNKIFMANSGSNNVTVIDGATNTTSTVSAGTNPRTVAVNPLTNKVYVANNGSNNVTVIDGATKSTSTVTVGTNPTAAAVNPVTNKVYVANNGSNDVTVIDVGANTTSTVSAGTNPYFVAVNPVTNKVYVANNGSGNVTVIDGSTDAVSATVAVGANPQAVTVDPVTNKIFVTNNGSGSITVIDGVTNTTETVTAGTNPNALAVNPVTNKVYAANEGSNSATVITEQHTMPNGILTTITPLAGRQSASLTPSFTLSSSYYGYPEGIIASYYQVDTWQGQWQLYTEGGVNRTPRLTPGEHILFAYAVDGQAATSTNTGSQSSPLVGTMAAYWFLVGQDTTGPSVSLATTAANPTNQSPISVTATFSEPVTGFASTGVTVSNGSISNFTGSGSDYRFDVTPAAEGPVTIDVAAEVAQDAAGNGNTAAAQMSITYDTTRPNATITATITGGGDTVNAPFTVTITFDKPVTGLSLSNIIVTNGMASDLTNVTPNLVWTVLITPTGHPGDPITITVTGVTDAAGNDTMTTPFSTMVQPTAALSPSVIAFIGTGLSGSNEVHAAIFTNTSAGTVTIGTITLTGTNPGDFGLGGTCSNGGSVGAGASCTITVTFSPAGAGERSAGIRVTSNAAGSPHTVTLSGNGTIAADSIVIDPDTPTTLYAGLDGAGIYKSIDSGGTWTPATTQPTNLRVKAVLIKPGDSAKLFAATYGSGVFKSVDSGDTWAVCENTNLTSLNVVSLTIDASGKLYAGTEAGVFVSTDGCAMWTAMNAGLPN